MAWDNVERRRTGEHPRPLGKDYEAMVRGRVSTRDGTDKLLDPETGFFTMPTLYEFIQYEIDGSAQTLRNELHVTPLCLAAIDVSGAPDVDEVRRKFLGTVYDAVRKITRTADRVARDDDRVILLLRRAMAGSLRDHYVPRLTQNLAEACAEFGTVTVSVGISSLVEHVARSSGHLVRMAQRALEEAQKTGGCVVYDFRVMAVE